MVFIHGTENFYAIPLDSIRMVLRQPSTAISTRSKIIAIGGAAIGAIIFFRSFPKKPDPSLWFAGFYGLEFGGAAFLGTITALGIGHVIDRATADTETFDLTKESRTQKYQIIREFFGPND